MRFGSAKGKFRFWGSLGVLALAAFAWRFASGPSAVTDRTSLFPFSWGDSPQVSSPLLPPAVPVEGDVRVLDASVDGTIPLPEMIHLTDRLNQPDTDIRQDVEILTLLFDTFRQTHDGARPPGGENDEITAQLRGRNSKHLAFIAPDHPAINEEGQLLDRWGTPYHFHPVSREELEFRSAGPDRKLFTGDDVFP